MEILRMAEEWLQEPEPDNGTVGELDVDEITVMIAGLVDKVKSLNALCDEYRGEIENLKGELASLHMDLDEGSEVNGELGALCKSLTSQRDTAMSALTRARAEGMEEAVNVVRSLWPSTEMGEMYAAPFIKAIRESACRLAEQANKG